MKRFMWIGALMLGAGLTGTQPSNAQTGSRDTTRLAAESRIFGAEEQYRRAKLQNDTTALAFVLNDQFVETNQNGNSRTKRETLALWETFRISSLTTDTADVRFSGDSVAMVTGSQTEVNGSGTDRMLFTRVWVRNGDAWQLLSSTQFRNPQLGPFTRTQAALRLVR